MEVARQRWPTPPPVDGYSVSVQSIRLPLLSRLTRVSRVPRLAAAAVAAVGLHCLHRSLWWAFGGKRTWHSRRRRLLLVLVETDSVVLRLVSCVRRIVSTIHSWAMSISPPIGH